MVEREHPWKQQAESFGRYLRMQRQLADLSLRELASMSSVSNAYLSQLERGMHQPSVRVLRALADALGMSASSVMEQFGRGEDADGGDAASSDGALTREDAARDAAPSTTRRSGNLTESAILADPRLSDLQKQTLVEVYRTFLGPAG